MVKLLLTLFDLHLEFVSVKAVFRFVHLVVLIEDQADPGRVTAVRITKSRSGVQLLFGTLEQNGTVRECYGHASNFGITKVFLVVANLVRCYVINENENRRPRDYLHCHAGPGRLDGIYWAERSNLVGRRSGVMPPPLRILSVVGPVLLGRLGPAGIAGRRVMISTSPRGHRGPDRQHRCLERVGGGPNSGLHGAVWHPSGSTLAGWAVMVHCR